MSPSNFFDDDKFKSRFRLSKELFMQLLQMLHLEHFTNPKMALIPELQLSIALRFYACGSFQIVIGDLLRVSKVATVSRVIKRVSSAIAMLRPQFIKFQVKNLKLKN